MKLIKRALVSVYDKSGIVDFVRQLVDDFHIEILSTGGTARTLEKAGIPYTKVSDFTKSPEMFDGRVKTLHPRIHCGLLMRRDNPKDVADAEKYGILPIDMVVCNLYPFKDVISKAETDLNTALEMIDIGGPTQIRAAAKSFRDVVVISNPTKYNEIINLMHENNGDIPLKTRWQLAQEIFTTTSLYDATIANYLAKEISSLENKEVDSDLKDFPDLLVKLYRKVQKCRYGENWEQRGYLYEDSDKILGLSDLKKLHGKAISFNNWLDIDSCMQVLLDFNQDHADHHICAIFKHTTPNGVAIDYNSQLEATKHAFSTDPLSAFGGIWGFNHRLTTEVARYIIEEKNVFVEVLLAPSFEKEALEILQTKANMRIVAFNDFLEHRKDIYCHPEIRSVLGGVLVQDYDWKPIVKNWEVKTERPISPREKEALIFAYRVSKWAKSNSAVFAKEYETGVYTLGIGAGQQSRVHVVRLAAEKAREFGHNLHDSVMGTDSFFPFPDGLEETVKAGAKAILNPGGSIRDDAVVQKANELNISLVFCGKRVFRH
ncbi:MAG: bifunctional phosphoribosylaminoimidazolecarboxamide formyltransferase/IMP cyclohydrolase PurH [Promethearchaeia archaeon]|nr:MAG: bifunctional phosphoribosylaminoimidazolecarboxamide formyltransferase/IMP cyclohydrolase PurH [Candidatus Lokiarchaeia archaeon]